MRQSTDLSEKSIKNYSNAIRKISNDLVRLKLAYSSLEELMQSEDPVRLKEEYFDIPEHAELDKRGKNMYSAGFNKLIEYHQEKYSSP
jgi:predicted RNA-binding protein with EMAP domain